MKKVLLSVACIVAFSVLSQAQWKFGVKAGVSRNEQRINTHQGDVFSNSHFRGYHAGVAGDLDLGSNFHLQPQLLFSRKGSTLLSSTGAGDKRVRMNYVELPVMVAYKIKLPFGNVFGGAGGSFNYALGGKSTQDGKSVSLFTNANDFKRIDLGLVFSAGLEFNGGMFVSLNSQKGLLDIHQSNAIEAKNRSMSVSVGYMLDGRKSKRKS